MDPEFLNLLGSALQDRVTDLERRMDIRIQVRVNSARSPESTGRMGALACIVDCNSAVIEVADAARFVDHSVLHELLHIDRFMVQGVPQLEASDMNWSPELERGLTELDNALEHLVIVPTELREFPYRAAYWSGVVSRLAAGIATSTLHSNEIVVHGACALAFASHVLKNEQAEQEVRGSLDQRDLFARANMLKERLIADVGSKETLALHCIDELGIDRSHVCLLFVRGRRTIALDRRGVGHG